jgi:hypothetical protein
MINASRGGRKIMCHVSNRYRIEPVPENLCIGKFKLRHYPPEQ